VIKNNVLLSVIFHSLLLTSNWTVNYWLQNG